jgi:hypothetical protein
MRHAPLGDAPARPARAAAAAAAAANKNFSPKTFLVEKKKTLLTFHQLQLAAENT